MQDSILHIWGLRGGHPWEALRRGQGFREKMLGPLAKAGSGKKKKEWLYFVQKKNKDELKVYGRKIKGSWRRWTCEGTWLRITPTSRLPTFSVIWETSQLLVLKQNFFSKDHIYSTPPSHPLHHYQLHTQTRTHTHTQHENQRQTAPKVLGRRMDHLKTNKLTEKINMYFISS